MTREEIVRQRVAEVRKDIDRFLTKSWGKQLREILEEKMMEKCDKSTVFLRLLLSEADRGALDMDREEVFHWAMQMAIRHDFPEMGVHLLDDHGVNLFAHEGLYLNQALAKQKEEAGGQDNSGTGLYDGTSLGLEFLSRCLSREPLDGLPLDDLVEGEIEKYVSEFLSQPEYR